MFVTIATEACGDPGKLKSLLVVPPVEFLPVADLRIANTIAVIERTLIGGGLVRRKPRKPGRSRIGNIARARTHLGVIDTALFLCGPVIQRAEG